MDDLENNLCFLKVGQRQIWYYLYMESKNNTNKSVHKIEIDSETRKQTYQRGLGGREEQSRNMGLIDILLFEIGMQQEFTVKHRKFCSASCNNLQWNIIRKK